MLGHLAVGLAAPRDVVIEDLDEQMPRGAAKDAIRAIDAPAFGDGAWLHGDDPVIGVVLGDVARAYPVRVLDYHEIVNDELDARPIAVTFCPLCGSGVSYDRRVEDRVLTFGVSGRLFRNDLVMFDRETGSLWPQILGQALHGPLEGNELDRIESVHTTWSAWRSAHPSTQVLERPGIYTPSTYETRSHEGYEDQPEALFERTIEDDRLPPKRWVLGIARGDDAMAVPWDVLEGTDRVRIELDGTVTGVALDQGRPKVQAEDAGPVETLRCYWFAWVAFHTGTRVLHDEGKG